MDTEWALHAHPKIFLSIADIFIIEVVGLVLPDIYELYSVVKIYMWK